MSVRNFSGGIVPICALGLLVYFDGCAFSKLSRLLKPLQSSAESRDIDTPEVREALDVIEPYCRPEWRITGFRNHLKHSEELGPSGEGQQQNLRVYFGGIHDCVRKLLSVKSAS